MDLRLLKHVNDLWSKIYPYLADHVMECYGKSHGDVLELGPFAGGISLELGPDCLPGKYDQFEFKQGFPLLAGRYSG